MAAAARSDWREPVRPIRVGVSACLLNHYVAKFDVRYVRDQVYLRPHPKELMLRNAV